MTDETIIIQHGLPEANRQQAAAILYEGLFSTILPRAGGSEALARLLDPARAIVALREEDLVGIAGLNYGGSRLTPWAPRAYLGALGLWRGLAAAIMLRLYVRPFRRGQLLMDGIAVAPEARGLGVGTQLLDAVCAFAREAGYTSVRLDVVNTNPRARALYARRGFQAVGTMRLPGFVGRWLGFTAYTTMVKTV